MPSDDAPELHPVWFERPVLAGMEDLVAGRCRQLGPATPDDPYHGLEAAAGAVASVFTYGAELFDHAPRLRVVARTGIGYDAVDVAEATRRGIVVCNVPDGPTVATAEHALALLLAVTKRLVEAQRRLEDGETDFYGRHDAMQLDGKTLGLVGYGRIARRVAVAAAALGMHVHAFDPYLTGELPVPRVDSLDELLESSDVVSLHVPLSETTRGMIGATELARMRRGAVLINTARGGLLDLEALQDALDAGHLAGAGLDVTAPEPLPSDHPLLRRTDVVVTPHIASATPETKRANFIGAFEQVIDVLDGHRPAHAINPEVWERRET